MNPKVFVCHASEDKERFVLGFATKLRSKGVDVWVDKWEMLPGDSLVRKVFEEGIKNAQAIIVVLSRYSVDKPWVREELDVSMVKKINEGSKLIPVIIDDCQVPTCLQATVWQKIENLNSYDAELERIVMSIYGKYDKPPLGKTPAYTKVITDIISGLTETDSLILKFSCEKAIEKGNPHIETQKILPDIESLGIHSEVLFEALEILDEKGYIEALRAIGDKNISRFLITTFGFDEYARVYINNYDSIITSVALQIINFNNTFNRNIAKSLNQPQMLIDHILDVLESRGFVKLSKYVDGGAHVYHVSAELKRMLSRQ